MSEIAEVVKTRRLEVYSDGEHPAITLHCWSDGSPFIRLYDNAGRERLVLSLDEHGQPQVSLLAENGATIVGIGIKAELGAGLNIFDEQGHLKVVAAVNPMGQPALKTLQS
jgi:hypothetical protein